MFRKARSPDDLELLRVARPGTGAALACPAGYYPELFVRVRCSFAEPADIYRDEPGLVRESSPLFWEPGTPAQVLAAGLAGGVTVWTLSLTRWGVLRLDAAVAGRTLAVESRHSIDALVDLARPFYAGFTLAGPWTAEEKAPTRARLVIGQGAGGELSQESSAEGALGSGFDIMPTHLQAGAGPGGWRPARAAIDEVFVANSELFHVFDDVRPAAAIGADFSGGSVLAPRQVDAGTAAVLPGVEFAGTGGNYWHFFRVDDPALRRVRIERLSEMSSVFFASEDLRAWSRLPVARAGLGPHGERAGVLRLPVRGGALYVANAPVYTEARQAADLAAAASLGAEVRELGRTDLGAPVHVVSLTRGPSRRGKAAVVLLCGQHSPLEQMGGWLGLPCLDELARLHGDGPLRGILDRLVFYWIPIFNADCARYGTPGNDSRRTNPNRCWFDNLSLAHAAVERYFLDQAAQGVAFTLMLDVHGGGAWRNHTVLADYDQAGATVDAGRAALGEPDRRKARWFAALDRQAGLREVWSNGCSTGRKVRAPEWFQQTFGCPAFSLECSVVSHLDPVERRTRPFTLASFEQLGRGLARVFAEGVSVTEEGSR